MRKAKNILLQNLVGIALPLLALVGAYFVYAYNALILPEWVAILSASGIACVYIGAAFVPVPAERRQSLKVLALGAMFTEATFGALYSIELILRRQLAQGIELTWLSYAYAIPQGFLHGAMFSIVAYWTVHTIWSQNTDAQDTDPLENLREEMREMLTDFIDRQETQNLLTDEAPAIKMTAEEIREAAQQMQAAEGEVNISKLAKQLGLDYKRVYRVLRG